MKFAREGVGRRKAESDKDIINAFDLELISGYCNRYRALIVTVGFLSER